MGDPRGPLDEWDTTGLTYWDQITPAVRMPDGSILLPLHIKREPMIEVEKGIEMPRRKLGQPAKYPVYTMEVGESFKFPIEGHYGVRGAIRRARPKKFSVRKIDDGHMRCWRVA